MYNHWLNFYNAEKLFDTVHKLNSLSLYQIEILFSNTIKLVQIAIGCLKWAGVLTTSPPLYTQLSATDAPLKTPSASGPTGSRDFPALSAILVYPHSGLVSKVPNCYNLCRICHSFY